MPLIVTERQGTPWYHESPEPSLFNEWTWTHFAWGMLSQKVIESDIVAIILHTAYEAIEDRIFPDPNRDVSMRNHVGDTIAFIAGRFV